MAIVNKFNVNKQEVRLDADIIENMSANDVSYDAFTQYNENTVGEKLSELEKEVSSNTSAIEKLNDSGLVIKDEIIEQDINNWLDKHPEATTTVQDGAITSSKMNEEFWNDARIKNDYVTPQMFGAKGDGVTNDTEAFKEALRNSRNIYVPDGEYIITEDKVTNPYSTNHNYEGILIDRSNVHIKMSSYAILKADVISHEVDPSNPFRAMILIQGSIDIVNSKVNRINNIIIEGGNIIGPRSQFNLTRDVGSNYENYCSIVALCVDGITIKDCKISDNLGDAIYTGAVDNLHVINVSTKRNRRAAISIGLNRNSTISNCHFEEECQFVEYANGNSSYECAPYAIICNEPEPSIYRNFASHNIENTIIENCYADINICKYFFLGSGDRMLLKNNKIYNIRDSVNSLITFTGSDNIGYRVENITVRDNEFLAVEDISFITKNRYIISYDSSHTDILVDGNICKNYGLISLIGGALIKNNKVDAPIFSEISSRLSHAIDVTVSDNNIISSNIVTGYISSEVRFLFTRNVVVPKIERDIEALFSGTAAQSIILTDNTIKFDTTMLVAVSVTSTTRPIIKNNYIEFVGTELYWFDINGNLRYVNMDLINNYIKSSKNVVLSQKDFTGKMVMINNIFGGQITKFTNDNESTEHILLSNNIYL